ncbi:hypothetical protein [Methylomonas sp. AM2-LC]|uniref:hypothetical protein n=1 Tax=Methylomonas sp. AM2-LC TaxID=3153301 RepID=UPI0032645843
MAMLLIEGVSISCAIAQSDSFSEMTWHGLLDLSYMHPEGPTNWLDNGLGKLSVNNAQSGSNIFNLNQATLLLQARLGWSWSSSVTAKYSGRQDIPVDISEALLLFRPVSTTASQFSARMGAFLPPVSMENTGVGWTSPYTLSSSTINSWAGEELKVFGGEAQYQYRFNNGDRIGVFASGFGNNDTAGVLLAWRGWALDNYTATLNDSFALPATGIGGFFPKQAAQTRPFVEVDNRPGFYTGISIERPGFAKFRAMYYDNRGNPSMVKNGQYAWHTRFGNMGLKMDLPWDTEFIGQAMLGETQMGNFINNQYAVDTSFWSGSILFSKKLDNQRFTVRYERFATSGFDYLPQDPNGENGQAWICNYNIIFLEQHQFNLEFSTIDSVHASRLKLGQLATQNEQLWQVAYRLFF